MRDYPIYRFAIIFIVALLFGCGEEAPTDDGDSSSNVFNPEVGVVQEEAFYVRLYDEGKFPFYMSVLGDFGKSCSIASGQQGQSIDCVLDINEYDLYFNGLSFQYNVPSSMCNYVQFNTFWYYSFETGYGPKEIEITQTKDGTGNLLSSTCVMDGVAGCEGVDATYSTSDNKLSCVYDHSSEEGPNCCLGSYTQTITTTVAAGSPTVSSSKGSWGGSVKNCIGGPGKTDWQRYSKFGYPVGEVTYTPSKGLNGKYQISAPIQSFNDGSNFLAANFYTSSKHTHSGYVSTATSSMPYIVDPIDDRNGDALASGTPAYTWRCLDQNDEVINQIRVYVREWNTNKEFLKYGTSSGTSGDPDISGPEGTNCGYYTSSSLCNDQSDFDDMGVVSPNAATKQVMFPKHAK